MKPTLSDLWRGEIHPNKDKTENNEKVKELRGNLEGYYNVLWNKLDSDGKQILCRLKDSHAELSLIENEDSFAQGFSLAVKMMTEALAE